MNALAERLRAQCATLRTKPTPLADLIPLLQQAADAIDSPREVTEKDAYTLIGHAQYLRMLGQEDMPRWCMDLAERIARDLGDENMARRTAGVARHLEEQLKARDASGSPSSESPLAK